MRKFYVLYTLVLIAQLTFAQIDSSKILIAKDTTLSFRAFLAQDSIKRLDSVRSDTLNIVSSDTANRPKPVPQRIDYKSEDSIYFDLDSMIAYMYEQVELKSKKMTLDAGRVKVDLKNHELYAYPTRDSLGKTIEKPVFNDGNDQFTAIYIKYNFKTRKGYARQVKTQQSEGFLHGQIVKIFPSGITNIKNGKFTTCNLDHPHYYIALTKAKYIPKKSIVSGPFYFVIEDIPFYFVGLPFGYFPQKRYNSSGIIAPTFHQELTRGYGLVGGGYYFALNDYMDLKVTGDIYSKGSWGITVASKFKVRYRFSGNFSFNYTHVTNGEPYLVGSFVRNSYSVKLAYVQDQKANPTSHFSININLDKGNNQQYNARDIQQFTNNTTYSSIAYQKRFRGLPANLAINANLTQNLSKHTIAGALPNISFNITNLRPFKNLGYSNRAWYKDIVFSLNSKFVNSFQTSDSLFFNDPASVLPLMKNGFVYSMPIQKSFRIFKYFNLTFGTNYTGRVYLYQISKSMQYVDSAYRLVVDTVFHPAHYVDFSTHLGLSTTLYGLFRLNFLGLKAIRHQLQPSVSFAYRPDFSRSSWGYYLPEPQDTTGTRFYAVVPNPVVGFPGRGKLNLINFTINNNFQAKIRSKKDTVNQEKKITLLDNLTINGSYNLAADSLNFSRIRVTAGTRILGSRINFSSSFDPYAVDSLGRRINVFEFERTGKILRLENLSISSSFQLNDKILHKKSDQSSKSSTPGNKEYKPYDYFNPKWNIRLSYRFAINRKFDVQNQIFNISMQQIINADFSINPTPFWQFRLGTGYDFSKMKMTNTTFYVYRDLHCWEMSLQVTPFGRMRGYYFSLKIKSPMLNFIQFKRQRSWHDNSYY